MIDLNAIDDSVFMGFIFDASKVVAANIYGDYEITDPVDGALANAEIIITIASEKAIASLLSKVVPSFRTYERMTKPKNAILFYLTAGVLTSAFTTLCVYPIEVFRANRKAKMNTTAEIDLDDHEENKIAEPSFLGGLTFFVANTGSSIANIVFNYARSHASKVALFGIAASFAYAQYKSVGVYKRAIKRTVPGALI